jgi:predicted  nucleic acid-binding Zn-ribbon protein
MAKKKTTLETLATQMQKGFASADRKFTALADDIADLKVELKGDIARVQEQVNSIEAQLKHRRYEQRLGKLEEEVFGEARV